MDIFERTTGYRTILNTRWPITTTVRRDAGGRCWVVTYGLCNGIPTGAELYRTKREALAAAATA